MCRDGLVWARYPHAGQGTEGRERKGSSPVATVVLASRMRMRVSRRCEVSLYPPNVGWEIDMEGTLAGVWTWLLIVLALDEKTKKLLALHLIFGE